MNIGKTPFLFLFVDGHGMPHIAKGGHSAPRSQHIKKQPDKGETSLLASRYHVRWGD
jgi:hypothetical protein